MAAVREEFGYIAELKQQHGFLFSGISTAIFGGLLPWIVMVLTTISGNERSDIGDPLIVFFRFVSLFFPVSFLHLAFFQQRHCDFLTFRCASLLEDAAEWLVLCYYLRRKRS